MFHPPGCWPFRVHLEVPHPFRERFRYIVDGVDRRTRRRLDRGELVDRHTDTSDGPGRRLTGVSAADGIARSENRGDRRNPFARFYFVFDLVACTMRGSPPLLNIESVKA